MATTKITIASQYLANKQAPKMVISTANKKYRFVVPIAPLSVTYSGIGWNWSEINRGVRWPLLLRTGPPLKKVTYELGLMNPKNPDEDQTQRMKWLEAMSRQTSRIVVSYGGYYDSGYWRINSVTFDVVRRRAADNKPCMVNASLELTRSMDILNSAGPVTGGKKPSSGKSTSSTKKSTSTSSKSKPKPKTKTYKVKSGDTLSKIASKVYGNSSKWRAIADYNKIKNANRIYVGQTLKLP